MEARFAGCRYHVVKSLEILLVSVTLRVTDGLKVGGRLAQVL